MSTFDGLERGFSDGMAIGRRVGDVLTYAFQILSRPLALLTQVFYRKDMGERYFTPIGFFWGLALLGLATFGSRYLLSTTTVGVRTQWGGVVPETQYVLSPLIGYGVGVAWIAVLAVAYSRHTVSVRARYTSGERWHSRTAGVPRMPGLIDPVQYAVTGVLAAACFYFGLPGYGALFAASLVAGMGADQMARLRFWSLVLDQVDARIEAENLGKAVAQRLAPASVEGLEAPVPGYVSEEWRRRNAPVREAAEVLAEPKSNGLVPGLTRTSGV